MGPPLRARAPLQLYRWGHPWEGGSGHWAFAPTGPEIAMCVWHGLFLRSGPEASPSPKMGTTVAEVWWIIFPKFGVPEGFHSGQGGEFELGVQGVLPFRCAKTVQNHSGRRDGWWESLIAHGPSSWQGCQEKPGGLGPEASLYSWHTGRQTEATGTTCQAYVWPGVAVTMDPSPAAPGRGMPTVTNLTPLPLKKRMEEKHPKSGGKLRVGERP
ncbi:hypothetical protein GWK47_010539 [Chionoecetes opilio]|uniref:Uncharacterized protein n=1 Tax=Chionoecetes opilio TaxID=41210 RepID=A0A8J4Y2C9_CHIOP|nr:hypothetical protein GWK47_010539 [Chionoecetes opilio]